VTKNLHVEGVDDSFLEVMLGLGSAYGTKVPAERMRQYAIALGDLDIDAVRIAAASAVRECSFFPTIAELRRLAVGTAEDAALLAWTSLGEAASRIGAWQDIEIEDGCAAAALVAVFGSWPTFCQLEEGPALAQRRVEFLAAYRQARRVGSTPNRLLPGLAGGRAKLLAGGGVLLLGPAETQRALPPKASE
jgi:hypothetical protein